MPARRHFGSVRRLPSGRYQASYWHLAERHVAPETFTTTGEAYAWLSTVEADVLEKHDGEQHDPRSLALVAECPHGHDGRGNVRPLLDEFPSLTDRARRS